MSLSRANVTRISTPIRTQGSVALVLCLIALGTAIVESTDQVAPSRAITGQVVDASTPALAVAGAQITLSSGPSGALATVTTDLGGRFTVENVPVGKYRVAVRADGYLPAGYGQRWPSGPTRDLDTNNLPRALTIWAWKESSISGQLTSTSGQRLAGATVTLFLSSRFVGDSQSSVRTTLTDEDGTYRFDRLSPGRYYVGAIQRYRADFGCRRTYQGTEAECRPLPADGSLPPQKSETGDDLVYETAFYPSSSDLSSASELALKAGEERTGIDLLLQLRTSHIIYGQTTGPDGALGQTEISLVRPANLLPSITVEPVEATAMTDPVGRFVLVGVVAGAYEVRAKHLPRTGPDIEYRLPSGIIGGVAGGIRPISRETPVLEAVTSIAVNESTEQRIAVELRRASTLTFRLNYQSGSDRRPRQASNGLQVRLLPLTRQVHSLIGAVDDYGTVEFPSVSTARYRVVLPARKGWSVQRIDGVPIEGIEDPLVSIRCCYSYTATIDLTDRPATLAGEVRDSTGSAVSSADIVIFPWLHLSKDSRGPDAFTSVLATDGAFSANHLLPGEYVVVALPDAALPFDWRDPEVLRALTPMGVRVSIEEGKRHSVVVRLSRR